MRTRRPGLALGLLLGAGLDAILADQRRWHPVAGFGRAANWAERRMWADSRGHGACFAGICAGAALGTGLALRRITRGSPAATVATTALATWTVLGGTSLATQASAIGGALAAGDLEAARGQLPALCGRDPAGLSEAELARAVIESVAENTSDAVVAPLLWGAAFGLPGLLGYRAVNTLDAMVGHRSARYRRFGWASARLDDVANLAPARLTAWLAVALAPAVGGSPRQAAAVLRRDGAAHPSPNSGHCEAAFAGALGIRVGGTNNYGGSVERRGRLGDGPPPATADIRRAIRLSRLTSAAAVILAAAVAALASASADSAR